MSDEPIPFCGICNRQIQPPSLVIRLEAFRSEWHMPDQYPDMVIHAEHLTGLLIGARA